MNIYAKGTSRNELEAFKELAASTYQSSVYFALRIHKRKAMKSRHGYTQPVNTARQEEGRELVRYR